MSGDDSNGAVGTVIAMGVIFWIAMGITLYLIVAIVATIIIGIVIIGSLVYYLMDAGYPSTVWGWLLLFFGTAALVSAPFVVMTIFVLDGNIFASVPYDKSPILPPVCFFWLCLDIWLVGRLHEWCADNM